MVTCFADHGRNNSQREGRLRRIHFQTRGIETTCGEPVETKHHHDYAG